MSRNGLIRSVMGLVLLGSGASLAWGADSAALSSLKAKGLVKSSHTFVLETEKPVLEKMKEVRASFASYASLADRQAMSEQVALHLIQIEGRRVELQDNLNDLNQRITEQSITAQPRGVGPQQTPEKAAFTEMAAHRDQLKSLLAEVTLEQRNLREQGTPVKDRKAMDDEVGKRGDTFKSALATLRPMVDEVIKQYAGLEADGSIKKALSDLEKESKANLKLGPSDAFLAGVKALDQAERRFLGKKTTAVAKKKAKARK